MKILITGGAGFIGSTLGIKLKERYSEYSIVAFDNLKRSGSEVNLSELEKAGIKFIHGDIRNIEDLNSVGAFDVLIEAAAEPSVLEGLKSDPTYIISNNLYGSINCLNVCLKYGAKIIFLSSSRVYPFNRIEGANYIEEETRFSFAGKQDEIGISTDGVSEELSTDGIRSFYGTTKLSTEQFIGEYTFFYDLKSAITRFGVIAGPRQMGKTDQGVATLWMAKHYWKQSLKYIGYGGSGKQVRDILHIDDLVNLIDIQIHQTEMFTGKIFNAGGGLLSSASLMEMTTICQEITGNRIKIEPVVQNRPADLRIYITDNTKIEKAVGWRREHGLKDTFIDIFNWIRKNEIRLKPFLY